MYNLISYFILSFTILSSSFDNERLFFLLWLWIKSFERNFLSFDDNSKFSISAELLRVEGPSADIQGHGGPKIIVKNKNDVLISRIEEVGNYAIRIIFSDDHSSGIFSWDLLYDFGKNQEKYLNNYYNFWYNQVSKKNFY